MVPELAVIRDALGDSALGTSLMGWLDACVDAACDVRTNVRVCFLGYSTYFGYLTIWR